MAKQITPPFLILNFEISKNQVSLNSEEEVINWCSTEAAYWNWLHDNQVHQVQVLRDFAGHWLAQLNRLRSQVEEVVRSPAHPQIQMHQNNIKSYAEALQRNYLPSNSTEAEFVKSIAENSTGKISAAAALMALSNWPSPSDNGISMRETQRIEGIVLAQQFREGISPKTNAAILSSIKKTIGEFSKQSQAIASEYEIFSKAQENWSEDYQATAKESLQSGENERAATIEKLKTEFETLKTDLELVKTTYESHMSLEAPVKYWDDRSATHNNRFRFFAWSVGASIVIATIAITFVYSWVVEKISGAISANNLLYAAITLLATTAALWLVRIILKIMLSERHLRNVAEEKSMMLQTYLAMTRVGEATKEDRHLVLASLFNSSADGIVKDEGAPDVGLTAVLSKLISK